MTRPGWVVIAVAIALAIGAGALVLSRPGAGAAPAAEANPTASVTIAPLRRQRVDDVVSAYGVVQADAAGALAIAAPKAAIVSRVLVRAGQTVVSGQGLVELANAPGTELAFRQATDAAVFAQSDLARVQRLYDERLAATDQLGAAKKALSDAQSALAAQRKQGSDRSLQTLAAPFAGVVTSVSAASGDHLAQDAPLVVLSRTGATTAKLGVEPSAARLSAGQAVTIRPVFGGAPVASRLAMVGAAADKTTGTLDAIAPLGGAAIPIGAAVRGEVVTGSHIGLLVPRAAVVFDETGPHLFTVGGSKAHRVFVTLGLDRGDDVEVSGALPPDAVVAVEGAYELQDGMAVKVRGR